ncbi:unnamed protein product [Heterosigma akashiwo]|mmetsp:Transcript_5341/g.7444  ORF Transcript_5341/g.7444 Transcript_5341/m.7444 type:complete len:86 (+) Transcript_5341:72-329(+)
MNAVITKFTNPSWYTTTFNAWKASYGTQYVKAGSGAPIIHMMALLGFVGYTAEYTAVGKYHVAHKKDHIKKAVAEYEAKHGAAHH